jgi:hypothetical protein
MAHVCRRVEIGRSGSIPEVKVEWEGSPIPVPYMYFRTSSMFAYAEFCAPDDLLNSVWTDIMNCAMAAGVAAGIAAVVASPAAALPMFQAAFGPCITAKLGGRATEIQVSLSTEQKPIEDWHR